MNGQFNEKFSFDPVTFPDGTTGEVYAASKRAKNNQDTSREYETPDEQFLGLHQSRDFSSPDADAVRDVRLSHYGERS